MIIAPWNAAWSAEDRYEIRPCRYANGFPALWSPHKPGEGRPIFAKPHMVRQRKSIAEWRCTVCGERTQPNDRWWFKLGTIQEGWFMTSEAPVHRACGERALGVCPHLRGHDADFEPMPRGFSILRSMVGGAVSERDFGLRFPPQGVVGHLKIAWPEKQVRRKAA